MDIHRVYAVVLPRFRRGRMQRFLGTFRPTPGDRILDIGGTAFNWELIRCDAHITLLNLTVPSSPAPPGLSFVAGDARGLEFPDDSFSIAFSNSVIEHLYTFEGQRLFAAEARRVAAGLWIQTPAHEFFFEPHFLTPFVHWLPPIWRRRILRKFTVWGLLTRPTTAEVDAAVAEIRLLTHHEMAELFPDCEIRTERFLFLPKSYIAVRARVLASNETPSGKAVAARNAPEAHLDRSAAPSSMV